MVVDPVAVSVAKLQKLIRDYEPNLLRMVQRPATSSTLRALETKIGAKLSPSLNDFYAACGGVKEGGITIEDWRLLEPFEILEEVQDMRGLLQQAGIKNTGGDNIRGVKRFLWHEKWIPFARNDRSDVLFVDTDPAPGGVKFQVIKFESGFGPSEIVAQDFRFWLARAVTLYKEEKLNADKPEEEREEEDTEDDDW